MTEPYTFRIEGRPKSKQRARVTKNGHAYTPKSTVEHEAKIREAYGDGPQFDGPVHMDIEFHPKYTQVTICEDDTDKSPLNADIDNLVKCVADALNGRAYQDDRQIHSLHVRKYPHDKRAS